MKELPVEPHEPQDTVPVNDIDQFAGLVSHWHQNRVAQLRAVLETPEDVEIVVQNEQGEEITLNASQRAGLQAGIYIALDLLGTLPFVVEMEGPTEEQSNDAAD